MPVFGSPTADTSGTTRMAVPPYLRAIESGTTPAWYAGCGKSRLVPPPLPYWNDGPVQAGAPPLVVRVLRPVSHPSSNSRVLLRVTPSDVPPTAVTHGL